MRYVLILFLFVAFRSNGQDKRIVLINEASRLQSAIGAKDSIKVSEFFTFPIAYENAQWFVENEMLTTTTSEESFLKNYSNIFSEDVLQMFGVFDLTQLIAKDSLSVTRLTSDLCTTTYETKVNGNLIEFKYYVNGRANVTNEHADETTDDFVCPEFAEFWVFELVDGKLKFLRHTIAG